MVQIIDNKLIEDVCNSMKFFDQYGVLPSKKVRVDITISKEAINKLEGKNRSQFINDLVMGS